MAKHVLPDVATSHLAAAKETPNGRSSEMIIGDDSSTLQQTVVALAEGHSLEVRDHPDEATLLVLSGSLRVRTAAGPEDAVKGDLLEVPSDPHIITARRDATALLTVSRVEQS